MAGKVWARLAVAGAVIGFVAGVAGVAGVAAPAAGPLVALARIEPGEWQIKSLGSDVAPRALCVSDVATLIQYGHAGMQCQRVVVTNDPDLATVHYSCPGIGHGVTSFKVATPRNFNLETQGILNGAPFDEQYEARRVGACAVPAR